MKKATTRGGGTAVPPAKARRKICLFPRDQRIYVLKRTAWQTENALRSRVGAVGRLCAGRGEGRHAGSPLEIKGIDTLAVVFR